ncbi:alpha/beta hydrolase [Shewanella algae]|uniref:alpha/beta hydrolase n=1 Tax=Shewanella algae TaxID=38313 RepID=UPI003D7C8ED8
MRLVFVHGWSVTSTETYGYLPQALAKLADTELEVSHLHLGRYISFQDQVKLEDVALAFEAARREVLGDEAFAVITHSTGAAVIRCWLETFFGAQKLAACPVTHMIMLAPANHGSALAQLGKSRLARIKAWFDGLEPGQKILDWLELGSLGQAALSKAWLNYDFEAARLWPLVLTGESIDASLYDYLNSYTAEPGSDGVVRVAAANMNYARLQLVEQAQECDSFDGACVAKLAPESFIQAPVSGFGIIPKASHSKEKMGIMRSVSRRNAANKPVVQSILNWLKVDSVEAYRRACQELTRQTQSRTTKKRYTMLVIRVWDDTGAAIEDFDFYLLSGEQYLPGILPRGFMQDKQRNQQSPNCLTLYLDAAKMQTLPQGKIGFKLVPRPDDGACYYRAVEFQSDAGAVSRLLKEDATLEVDLLLKRHRDGGLFTLVSPEEGGDFSRLAPQGELADI